jgi:DNA processing protein
MVNHFELRVSEEELLAAISPLMLPDSQEKPTEYFASISWSLICEPGDAFAGLLISSFGAAKALALELAKTSPAQYLELLTQQDSSIAESFRSFEKIARDARERWTPRMNLNHVLEACEDMGRRGGWFATGDYFGWPARLADLENHAPRGLWGIGKSAALAGLAEAIAFVGSRICTQYGQNSCVDLIEPLVERGVSIVSGGAYGIDAAAHRATIAVGGVTIAVMAGGLDKFYPSGNSALFDSIRNNGALVSEMPPGAEPTKWRFLQRNRLIAALGAATVVVEANPRSGAVSTANRALELSRPVGAVPGPIGSSASDGCHQLIRAEKATLITCAQDILELVTPANLSVDDSASGLGPLETRVYDVIGFRGADLAKICTQAGLTKAEAEIGLASLSLLGFIELDSRGWRRLR